MKTNFRKILATTALCLAAVGVCVSCSPEHEYIHAEVGGAEIPAGWDFSTEKQWTNRQELGDGSQLQNKVFDLSGVPEFASYCGKEVRFRVPLAIQRVDYEAGTYYRLTNHKTLSDGVVDLYRVPVQKGKLLAVRALLEERLKPGRKVFDLEGFRVEALLEIQHPDAQVNNGKPLYLTYVLADHETPPHRIRAPWGPEPSPDSPHALELFINYFKSASSTGG
ncbi:MAG: hypothetical protein Q4F38_09100 [Akkermansia sp.]|nr:hypothetical protein [Akkermansia sp.]